MRNFTVRPDAQAAVSAPSTGRTAVFNRRALCMHYGIGLTTFHAIVKSGALNVHKVGRRTLIDAAEAERWWASCAKGRG